MLQLPACITVTSLCYSDQPVLHLPMCVTVTSLSYNYLRYQPVLQLPVYVTVTSLCYWCPWMGSNPSTCGEGWLQLLTAWWPAESMPPTCALSTPPRPSPTTTPSSRSVPVYPTKTFPNHYTIVTVSTCLPHQDLPQPLHNSTPPRPSPTTTPSSRSVPVYPTKTFPNHYTILPHQDLPQPLHHRHGQCLSTPPRPSPTTTPSSRSVPVYPTKTFPNHYTIVTVSACLPHQDLPQPLHHRHGQCLSTPPRPSPTTTPSSRSVPVYRTKTFPNHYTIVTVSTCLPHQHLPQPLHHRHGQYLSTPPTPSPTTTPLSRSVPVRYYTIVTVSTCLPHQDLPQPLHHCHGQYLSTPPRPSPTTTPLSRSVPVYPTKTFPNHYTIVTVSTCSPLHHSHSQYLSTTTP